MGNKYKPEMNEQQKKSRKKQYEKSPWMKNYKAARQRCSPSGKYYKKEIKFEFKPSDVEYLWFRDKAFNMQQPTIDRIDVDGNYNVLNCRFVEKRINDIEGGRRLASIKKGTEFNKEDLINLTRKEVKA